MSTSLDPGPVPRRYPPTASGWIFRATGQAHRLALRLYPGRLRQRYGAEMLQVLQHRWDKEQGAHPRSYLPRVWWYLVKDLAGSIRSDRREIGRERRRSLNELIASVFQDMRYATRGFLKSPGFVLVAVLTVALGVGANVAIRSVVNAVVLRPLPFPDSARIARLWPSHFFSARQVIALQQETDSYEAIAAGAPGTFTTIGDGAPEQLGGSIVGAGHFDVLGVPPALGRAFHPDDSAPGASPVTILNHGYWVRRFGADPDVIGRSLAVEGEGALSRTVVGVMPPAYEPFPWHSEIFVPMIVEPGTHDYDDMHRFWLLGRLRPDVAVANAQAELQGVTARLAAGETPVFNRDAAEIAQVVTYHESRVGGVRGTLWILLAAVGAVLLVACTNVANLLLARSGVRQQEVAVRAAIGASRWRIIRQLLTENAVLGVTGGLVGLAAAQGSMSFLLGLLPANTPRTDEVSIDAIVLTFALGISLVAGLVFGLVPAFRVTRADRPALRERGRGITAGRSRFRLNNGLVAAEVAISVILVVAAGLLVKSLWMLQQVDPGFNVGGVTTMRIAPPTGAYPKEEQRRLYYRQVEERVAALPGVVSVGLVNVLPLTRGVMGVAISPDGQPVPPGTEPERVSYRAVTPGYVDTFQIPLLEGRDLGPEDRMGGAPAGLINRALARRLWPHGSAVGKQVSWSTGEPWFTVVGVLGDFHQTALSAETRPEAYVPYDQESWLRTMHLAVRSAGEVDVAASVREAIWSVDPNVVVADETTMEQVLERSMATPRSTTLLFSGFALLALALGAIGVFGVMTYIVSQRTHEIGVRLALGATRSDVVLSTLRSGMAPALAGLVIGGVGSMATGGLLSSLLFEVAQTDPGVLAGVMALFLAVTMLANLLPALRAAKVDPVLALRQ